MTPRTPEEAPDSTAVRTALWRAMHVEIDPPPHVIEDVVGLQLAAPPDDWRSRQDMHPQYTRRIRAAIVARARFVEDLVVERAGQGVDQYVILGAGLDTFVQRRPDVAARVTVFEIDRPGPQAWKERRLEELGLGVPERLRFVPVDFEGGASWRRRLEGAGFDARRPAIVASTGVSMYLPKEVTAETLRAFAKLAPGSTLAMTFLLTADLLEPEDRQMFEWAQKGAAASGTPFGSLFAPDEMLALARQCGLAQVRHVSGVSFRNRYFAGRTDGLRPGSGEDFLLATL